MQHYCSSLDTSELPAALVMLTSLRALGQPFRLHALCLSDAAAIPLASLNDPDLSVVRLGMLEDGFPALSRTRASGARQRSLLVPFLAAFCLDGDSSISRITVLPPTILFHHDPQPVFDALGPGGIGLVRGPSSTGDDGWISYPATAEGRRYLADHQASCLARDGDATPASFAPSSTLHPDFAIVAHDGAHVAAWDLDARGLQERDGRLWCGDAPLLWYRFSNLRCTEALTFDADRPEGTGDTPASRRLYRGYFAKLVQTARALRARFPNLQLATPTSGVATRPAATAQPEWAMQSDGWRQEVADAGWNDETVNQLRLHRLLDLNARVGSTAPLDFMAWRYCITLEFVHTVARAARKPAPVSVLDWGGGLGEHYLYLRALWPDLAVEYHVRDVPAVCDYARAVVSGIRFHESDETAFGRRYDVVFGSSMLQYVFDWRATLAGLVQATGQYLLLTRVPMVAAHPGFVVRQCPQLYGGTTSYQSWVFGQQSFSAALAGAPIALVRETLVEERIMIPDAPEQPVSRGLLLARTG
jgi:putative methyltransferase (TIGR04325 family)